MQRQKMLLAVALLASACVAAAADASADFKLTPWSALRPSAVETAKELQGLNLGALKDSDPKAIEALDRLKRELATAPTVSSMDDARIRIPGYVVPLEVEGQGLREFLLVPYFGACIHTPPPPANQIIHVTVTAPLAGIRAMDTVWVSGQLHQLNSDTSMGSAGYRMQAVLVAPYRDKR